MLRENIAMNINQLKPDLVIRGALFPEPVQVITTILLGLKCN
jgi:hypothetical protein